MSWTPIYCFAVIAIVFVISEFCSNKTKGYVSFLVFASIFFAAGFWSGLLPSDLIPTTGISGMLSGVIMPIIIVNMGASININSMLKEWKTVVISLAALIGIAALCCTIGMALFGREYAFAAVGPIAGGLVAAQMVQEAAAAVDNAFIGAFAMVLISVQNMLGMPIATWCIKHDVQKKIQAGQLDAAANAVGKIQIKEVKLFPDLPAKYATPQMNFAKMAIIAALGMFIGTVTPIPAAVMYLVLGCLACTVNFLPTQPLGKAGGFGFFMFCMMTMAPSSFAGLAPAKFLEMIVPIMGLMALGIAGLAIFAVIAGKFFGYSPAMSIAIGTTALLGYPNTQIITEEAVNSMECTDEQKAVALQYALPKMIVGGFASVTVASVILTSIIVPYIFG